MDINLFRDSLATVYISRKKLRRESLQSISANKTNKKTQINERRKIVLEARITKT